MSIDKFIKQLKEDPEKITFPQSISVIEENYRFSPVAFKNGKLFNEAGENNGSCKIFYFGLLLHLSEEETLSCFGEYYREVLHHPNDMGHQNIRNFIKTGWSGIQFHGTALQPK